MNKLSIVLKITERCNLNCSYCYFFNGSDQSYKERPARMADDDIDSLIEFLSDGIRDLSLGHINIGFHGGEPLLYGRKKLDDLCTKLSAKLSSKVKLTFSLQSNGLLIDERWIDIFKKHSIGLGISVDGPKEYNDKYRVDFQGNGSYDILLQKIELLHNLSMRFGILSVINPDIGGLEMYNFITKDLKIKSFDVLFPHLTHDEEPMHNIKNFGKFLVDLFNVWVSDDNRKVRIRLFESFLRLFMGRRRLLYGLGATKDLALPLVTIRGDGDLEPVTGLMYTDPQTVTKTGFNIKDINLNDFLKVPIFQEIAKAQLELPEKCKNCCWEHVCGGGNIIDRFSKKNRFNNPSTYCQALQELFSHMAKYLLNCGVSFNKLNETLKLETS
ncbi:MAG: radical SAM protein [Rickettsiaceae bacterium]|nr:radical SAM protein [Rickettsiaceae bacterium]